jgi:hypothetical protein
MFCTLYNDAFLCSDCTASDDWLAVKGRKEVEGSDIALEDTILGVSGANE